jgi:hypothetical protein
MVDLSCRVGTAVGSSTPLHCEDCCLPEDCGLETPNRRQSVPSLEGWNSAARSGLLLTLEVLNRGTDHPRMNVQEGLVYKTNYKEGTISWGLLDVTREKGSSDVSWRSQDYIVWGTPS